MGADFGIDDDRIQHSIGVARVAQEITEQNYVDNDIYPQDMFVLGLVHDIGYAFCEKQNEHSKRGGELLRANGYQYWQEVYHYGLVDIDYESTELDILNIADICVGPEGARVKPRARLQGIKERYGPASDQHKKAKRLVSDLTDRIDFFGQSFQVSSF